MNRYKVFLRTDQQNIDGTCTVCLRYVSQRQKSDISLNIRTTPKSWDNKNSIVKKDDIDFQRSYFIVTAKLNFQLGCKYDYFYSYSQIEF